MDKWTMILIDMEDMWANSAQGLSAVHRDISAEEYRKERDRFKADRIYSLYGYEYLRKFIDRCPHIVNEFDQIVPCYQENNVQCTMFCHKYDFEKGCTLNATK
jgi:hypothetical protein